MASGSKIEWTQITWNPVTGCTPISQGCSHCYAERMAKRLKAMGQERYRQGFSVTLHHDLLALPLRWRRPRLVFVNSMSDLFHDQVPVAFIQQVFQTMAVCPQHTFQLLTKRSDRLRKLASQLDWPNNVWAGVSIENEGVLSRVEDLVTVPAAVRFLSCEPLLGPLEHLNLEGVDWVIVGGESGPGARPIQQDWVRSILRQCSEAQVAFFFKQWGGTPRKRKGRTLNGRIYDEMPVSRR